MVKDSNQKAPVVTVLAPAAVPAPTLAPAYPGAVGPRVDPATAFLSRYISAHSRRAMESSLRVLGQLLTGQPVADVRHLPWEGIRYEHAQALRGKLAEKYASTSANRHLMALRGIVQECWRLGLVPREVYDRVADVQGLRASRPDAGRALSNEEVLALYQACPDTPVGRRDAVLLVLTLGAGLRRSEVCALDVGAWTAQDGSVQVLGKGRKYRTVYLSPNGQLRMKAWLEVRGPLPGPLVLPCNPRGQLMHGKRMSDAGLYAITQDIGRRAKVPAFRPHDLRRTFITKLLDKGADALVVSKLAGHESVQTTLRYDKRGDKAKRAAVALLDD